MLSGKTYRLRCEVEVGESIQLQEECVHKFLNLYMGWVLLLLCLCLKLEKIQLLDAAQVCVLWSSDENKKKSRTWFCLRYSCS